MASRVKLEQFTFLSVAAAVDGEIGPDEERYLLQLAQEHGLELESARDCLAKASSHAKLAIDPAWTGDERWSLLEQLARVVKADGVVEPVEVTFVTRVGAALGCDPAQTRALLRDPEPAPPEPSAGFGRLALLTTTPTHAWCWIAMGLLLCSGFALILGPNVLQSQLRAVALLAAVLVGGAAYREGRRFQRSATWVLTALIAVAWISRHSLGNFRYGLVCMLLGSLAFGLGVALRERRSPTPDDRPSPRQHRGLQHLLLVVGLIAVAGALGTGFAALGVSELDSHPEPEYHSPSEGLIYYLAPVKRFAKTALVALGTLALGVISLVAFALGGAAFLSYLAAVFTGWLKGDRSREGGPSS